MLLETRTMYTCGRKKVFGSKFHLLLLPVKTFKNRTQHPMFTMINHPYSLRVSLIKRKFQPEKYYLKTLTLWNKLRRTYFPVNYNLVLCKSWVKWYIYIRHVLIIYISSFLLHPHLQRSLSETHYPKWLLGHIFDEQIVTHKRLSMWLKICYVLQKKLNFYFIINISPHKIIISQNVNVEYHFLSLGIYFPPLCW